MLAARNILGVPVSNARDIAQVVALIRERAAQTPPGRWILTAADWHELQLAERRLPTAAELDAATADHPVLLQRGGTTRCSNPPGSGKPASALARPTSPVASSPVTPPGAHRAGSRMPHSKWRAMSSRPSRRNA
jgi:hypothetical protein